MMIVLMLNLPPLNRPRLDCRWRYAFKKEIRLQSKKKNCACVLWSLSWPQSKRTISGMAFINVISQIASWLDVSSVSCCTFDVAPKSLQIYIWIQSSKKQLPLWQSTDVSITKILLKLKCKFMQIWRFFAKLSEPSVKTQTKLMPIRSLKN